MARAGMFGTKSRGPYSHRRNRSFPHRAPKLPFTGTGRVHEGALCLPTR